MINPWVSWLTPESDDWLLDQLTNLMLSHMKHKAKLKNKVSHANLKLTKGWGFNTQPLQIFKIQGKIEMGADLVSGSYIGTGGLVDDPIFFHDLEFFLDPINVLVGDPVWIFLLGDGITSQCHDSAWFGDPSHPWSWWWRCFQTGGPGSW